jgi:hypothetical protein
VDDVKIEAPFRVEGIMADIVSSKILRTMAIKSIKARLLE